MPFSFSHAIVFEVRPSTIAIYIKRETVLKLYTNTVAGKEVSSDKQNQMARQRNEVKR